MLRDRNEEIEIIILEILFCGKLSRRELMIAAIESYRFSGETRLAAYPSKAVCLHADRESECCVCIVPLIKIAYITI